MDLRPEAIIIDETNTAKIGDFGRATFAGTISTRRSAGAMQYMAPEAIANAVRAWL